MEKLSKKKALELCIEHWHRIKKSCVSEQGFSNGDFEESEDDGEFMYGIKETCLKDMGYQETGGVDKSMSGNNVHNACFLCEYTLQNSKDSNNKILSCVENCPAYNYWDGKPDEDNPNHACERLGSSYVKAMFYPSVSKIDTMLNILDKAYRGEIGGGDYVPKI